MKNRGHKGQVALVLVLIMTVVAALAVSLATRSTSETKIQETESESLQALIFAQTGIEQLVMSPELTGVTQPNYLVTKSELGSDGLKMGRIEKGSTFEINLTGADFASLSGIEIYWSPDLENVNAQPAILVSIISTSGSITDYAFAYDSTYGFTAGSTSGDLKGYARKTPSAISVNANTAKVRVSVLGSAALVGVFPVGVGALLPSQITSIRSTGLVASSDKTVKYGLQYDESATDNIPGIFDYAVFSGGTIVQ